MLALGGEEGGLEKLCEARGDKRRVRVIKPGDKRWPSGFSALKSAPDALFLRGSLPASDAHVVAIIGTRASTRRAEGFTEQLAASFARQGIWVVSGGALGIDTAAHRGALKENGRTIVVQASGLEQLYPKRNIRLFDQIVEAGGAIVSESEPNVAPHRGLFLKRNRLVAAWSRTTYVVQAPLRSGALHTGRTALRLGRCVKVALGPPWDPRHAGCEQLIEQGATRMGRDVELETEAPPDRLSTEAQMLLHFVEADDGQSADQLSERAQLSGTQACQALFELELAGLVDNRAGLFTSKS